MDGNGKGLIGEDGYEGWERMMKGNETGKENKGFEEGEKQGDMMR